MKQEYQHKAEAYDFKNGEIHSGCFRTDKEAKDFIAEKRGAGFVNIYTTSRPGTCIYGRWIDHFDTEKYMNDVGDWWAS